MSSTYRSETPRPQVDKRMKSALQDLKDKYDNGGDNEETSVHGPSGAAYQQKQKAIDDERRQERRAASFLTLP